MHQVKTRHSQDSINAGF